MCPRLLESIEHVLPILPNPLLVLGVPPMLGRRASVPPRNVCPTASVLVLWLMLSILQQLIPVLMSAASVLSLRLILKRVGVLFEN